MSTAQAPTDPTDDELDGWAKFALHRRACSTTVWTALGDEALLITRNRGWLHDEGVSLAGALAALASACLLIRSTVQGDALGVVAGVLGTLAGAAVVVLNSGKPRYHRETRDQLRVELAGSDRLPQSSELIRRAHARIAREPGRFAVAGRQIPHEVSELLRYQGEILNRVRANPRSAPPKVPEVEYESEAERELLEKALGPIRPLGHLEEHELAAINQWIAA